MLSCSRKFYSETLSAISKQTISGFDLIIVNDRMLNAKFPDNARVIDNDSNLTPLKLREVVFNRILNEGYDLLLSIDSDDVMSSDRVEKVIECWNENRDMGFYYDNLNYLQDKSKPFFTLPKSTTTIENIMSSNYVGLSHMTINLEAIRKKGLEFSFPSGVVALDWYLACWLLSNKLFGRKSDSKVFLSYICSKHCRRGKQHYC